VLTQIFHSFCVPCDSRHFPISEFFSIFYLRKKTEVPVIKLFVLVPYHYINSLCFFHFQKKKKWVVTQIFRFQFLKGIQQNFFYMSSLSILRYISRCCSGKGFSVGEAIDSIRCRLICSNSCASSTNESSET
jgi:hypothetical protein